jgi:hypothetical protein
LRRREREVSADRQGVILTDLRKEGKKEERKERRKKGEKREGRKGGRK